MYQYLNFPPGIFTNGTKYQNRGRWIDGDRVRWHHGLLRPIGGWDVFNTDVGALDQVLTDPVNQKARALAAWKANDGLSLYVVGHNQGLKAFRRSETTVTDITPAGFVSQPAGPVISDGYGNWFYGLDAYGTPRPTDESSAPIFNWCFRNWGEHLLAAARGINTILYEWDATFTSVAEPVANAPTDFDCFHVTDQRIVIVAGDPTEARLVKWSTSENNTEWTPTITNQAGFQTLPGVGRFKEIVSFRDQIVLISETDVYTCTYIGPPYVFKFDKVGENCGVSTGAAVVVTEEFIAWPGEQDFFVYDGAIRRIDCPVISKLQENFAVQAAGKITGFVNAEWSEMWWLYQADDDDVTQYVAWDFKENHWDIGTIDRTVGNNGLNSDNGTLMIGNDGYAYLHEQEDILPIFSDVSEIFITSGPIEFKNGNATQYISSIQPDFIEGGEVNVYLIGEDRPNGPETTFGPYPISYPSNTNQPVPCRARGHTVSARIEGKSSSWSLGDMRLNLLNGGGKK